MKTAVLLSTFVVLWDLVAAVHFPIVGKRQTRHLERRSTVSGSAALTDSNDVQYSANITLGGLSFSVLIDTGSADLWVASSSPIPGAVDTGVTSGVQYAVGSVQGPVQLAALSFADHNVPHQAYIFVTADNSNLPGTGLIGLGPSSGSNILATLNSSIGNTPLDSIFLQDLTTPNFISILLGRADEPGNPFPGDITVGELLPGYEAVTSQPKLNVSVVSLADYGNQHWQTLLDQDGVIGPDGNPISLTTVTSPTSNPRQLMAVFDSGFSLPQVPKQAADAFYGAYHGAQFVDVQGLGEIWTLPCNSEVNIAFKMGGNTYNVHPLDAVLEPIDLGFNSTKNAQGVDMCFGAFQPVSFDAGGLFDMILGMAFLRNTYITINFGDFVLGTPNRAPPYIQLLSTTNDTAQAHKDFVTVRGSSSTPYNLNTQNPSNGGNNNNNNNSQNTNWLKSHRTILFIIIGCALGGVAMCALGVFLCCRKPRSQRAFTTNTFGSYAPLNAPAPAPATDMHMPPAGQYGWQPQHQQQYSEPWAPKY